MPLIYDAVSDARRFFSAMSAADAAMLIVRHVEECPV